MPATFAKRRLKVKQMRRARRRRRVLREGMRLVLGDFKFSAVLGVIVVVAAVLWLWRALEIKNHLFGAPTSVDWEAMSDAVTRKDASLCDNISESSTLWTPSDYPTIPMRTLREECRSRVMSKMSSLGRQKIQPALEPSGPRQKSLSGDIDAIRPTDVRRGVSNEDLPSLIADQRFDRPDKQVDGTATVREPVKRQAPAQSGFENQLQKPRSGNWQ